MEDKIIQYKFGGEGFNSFVIFFVKIAKRCLFCQVLCSDMYGNTIKTNEIKLVCMTFIDPATGWFEIKEVPLVD